MEAQAVVTTQESLARARAQCGECVRVAGRMNPSESVMAVMDT